ncbi:MAG TPA: hypothetical protein VM146_16830 [Steroidobacteraceae bacterium]|nr:hypothetical protein [Steroidobacteraceae bacterium]
MARVPTIDTPCPIAGKQLPEGATEHCSLCDRSVHNLDLMSDGERREFMSACSGKVCVAYTVRLPATGLRRRALAPASLAAALAAAAMASLPAAAQESPVVGQSPIADENGLPNCDDYYEVFVGGVNKGDQAEWVDDGKDAPPELPTIDDDGR